MPAWRRTAPAIVEALAGADEVCIALPSVAHYRSDAPGSPHRLLAQALARRTAPRPLIVYCAENHRAAAAHLEAAVRDALAPRLRDQVAGRARFADTVIGKMSGLVTDAATIEALGLVTVTPGLPWAFLVEEFDRILVSRLDRGRGWGGASHAGAEALHPGMPVLREVDDLAPFEDAKLLGHNATHALGGFLGALLGLRLVSELEDVPGAMAFLRTAFIEESGRVLIRRHAGADRLFTPEGYAAFADDLLARMVNPFLADTIERAARDPRRKLAWDDRLIGLIRLGLAEAVPTPRYAVGVAAGLEHPARGRSFGRHGRPRAAPRVLASGRRCGRGAGGPAGRRGGYQGTAALAAGRLRGARAHGVGSGRPRPRSRVPCSPGNRPRSQRPRRATRLAARMTRRAVVGEVRAMASMVSVSSASGSEARSRRRRSSVSSEICARTVKPREISSVSARERARRARSKRVTKPAISASQSRRRLASASFGEAATACSASSMQTSRRGWRGSASRARRSSATRWNQRHRSPTTRQATAGGPGRAPRRASSTRSTRRHSSSSASASDADRWLRPRASRTSLSVSSSPEMSR